MSRYNISRKKREQYKKGKICVGLGEQEAYLSEFQFKGSNNLRGIWIVQDYKNDFYQHVKTIARGTIRASGTSLFKKITFLTSGKRILSDEIYRLGIKRTKSFTTSYNKTISFYPRDISRSECPKWYNCEERKDCLKCSDYFNLKTVKKINFRFKLKDVLSLGLSKKRFKGFMIQEKNHYLVRGFSMTKISKPKPKKTYPNAKTEKPLVLYQNEFITYEKYLEIREQEKESMKEALERTNRSRY